MQTFWQDIRYGLRMLLKTPGATLAAVIMLALGSGANTALFSAVKAVVLSSLPYAQPERLVTLAASDSQTLNPLTVSYLLVQDWKERSESFKSIALYRGWVPTLSGLGKAEVLRAQRVSYDFFPTLGVSPMLGREMTREEDRPDRRYVVLLSYGYWKEKFAGRKEVLGTNLLLNHVPYQIIGVLPADFEPLVFSSFDKPPQIWAPLGYDALLPFACRSCQHLRSVARLKDGAMLEAARVELNNIATRLAREFPNDYAPDASVVVTPLHTAVAGKVSKTLWLLLGATGFVLLITCVNVANLMLVRAATRRREMAVRAALGANAKRLFRQLLTETMILTLAGGLAGVLLATWGLRTLQAWAPADIPRLESVRVDAGVLLFTLAASVASGIFAGGMPAFVSSRSDARDSLQSAGRGSIGLGRGSLRAFLVVTEVALAFVLTIGTGLLVRSLDRVLGVHPGFDPHNLQTASFNLVDPKYEKGGDALQFEEAFLERIQHLPGVENAAMVSTLPLGGGFDRRGLHIQDRPLNSVSEAPSVDAYFVTPAYFESMHIPLLKGRVFNDADAAVAAKAPVAVVSESTAHQMWPGEDPLGKAIQLGGRDDKKPWATIVGIVGDVRQYGLADAPTADAYLLESQNPSGGGNLVIRTSLPTAALAPAMEEQAAALDKSVPLYAETSMEQLISASLAQRRFVAALVGGFCVLAISLACLGIYGVVAQQVSQRTGEIGIRVALGAQPRQIMRLVLGNGVRMVSWGIAVGVLGALALSFIIGSQLFEISPTDPITYVVVAVMLAIVAIGACALPARRAMRVDPMVALRYE
jgi:putative ABC transport system permease protein